MAAGAAIGFSSACYIFTYRIEAVSAEFSSGIIPSVLTNLLGFFGGDALGVSQAWIVIPIIAVFALAAVSEIDRQKPAKPVHFLLLLLSAPVLMAFAGFATPRSFLYLTPVTAALITMFFDRQIRQGYVQRAIAVVVITFATSAAAIANLISGTHPFKRNSVVPYQAIFDFIDRNANGRTLVVSTDPVAPWVLRGAEDRCAGYFLEVTHCLRADRRYDSIFVISSHTAIQSTCCRCHGRTEEASKRANRPRRGCVIEKPADRCAARRKYFDGRLLPVSRSGGERIIPYWPCARLR